MSENDAPGASSESAAPPLDTEEKGEREVGEEVDPADELELPPGFSQSAGRDMFVDCTILALNNEGEGRTIVNWWRLRDEFATPPPSFVKPPHFDSVVRRVREERVAVLLGGECGSVTVAATALRMAGHSPVIELQASQRTNELLAAIAHVCREMPRAGIVVASLGEETIRGFGASELRRLRGSLGQAATILTTRVRFSPDASEHALPTIEAVAPEPGEIVRSHAVDDLEVCERAELAAEMLSRDGCVGPGKAVALVQAARTNRGASPGELAALLSGRSDAMDEWLASRPTAEQVASLVAAIALDGVPTVDVDALASQLQQLLEDGVEPATETKRFGSADRGWPAGVLETTRAPLATYFGIHEAEVAKVCSPHRREELFGYLWDHLGSEFRTTFTKWLGALAEHPSPRVRSGAAVTAGILFAKEPMTAERELLRPWALDGRRNPCECAGLAIGIPIVLGADPAPPRALAYVWSAPRSGANRVRAAIAAYAGPLGAWDLGSGAPAHLWRIAQDAGGPNNGHAGDLSPLRRAADNALAALTASGAEASHARETVIGLLCAQAESQQTRDRIHAFGLLPKALHRLTRRDELARMSLTGLLSGAEQKSFLALAGLLAQALDVPAGAEHGRAAIVTLLDALGAGRIDQDVVNQVVRAMKAEARPGRRSALGQQLERVLSVERRREDDRGRAAAAVHATFFTNQRRFAQGA